MTETNMTSMPSGAKAIHAADTIGSELDRLRMTIDEVLDVSRAIQDRFVPVLSSPQLQTSSPNVEPKIDASCALAGQLSHMSNELRSALTLLQELHHRCQL